MSEPAGRTHSGQAPPLPPAQMFRILARRLRRRLTGSHRPDGGVVLAYHRVAEFPHAPPSLAVEPRRLREHLAFFRDHGMVMSLADLVERAETATLPPRAVALTFDDGYRDVLRVAAPMLASAGIPASVFVTTAGFGSGSFWWDGAVAVAAPSLSEAEVFELSRLHGITVGSHTHSHVALAGLSAAAQRREVREGRQRLEDITGRAVTEFAYPFGGRHDFSRISVDIVRDAGITIACSTIGGTVHRGIDRLRVPRVVMRNWSVAELADQWASWTKV